MTADLAHSKDLSDFWFDKLTTIARASRDPSVDVERMLETLANDIIVALRPDQEPVENWILKTFDSLEDVQPEDVDWLWDGYVARAMFTLVEGDPGSGKSYTLGAITSAISNGGRLPAEDGSMVPIKQGKILLCANEDHWGNTIRPRHEKMGANLKNIRPVFNIVKKVGDKISDDEEDLYLDERGIDALEREILAYQPDLVVIDPLSAYFPPDRNQAKEVDVRTVLRPLAAIAQQSGAAVIGVRHLTKMPGQNLLYSGQGSIAYIAQARFALRVGIDPGDHSIHYIMPIKNSIQKKAKPQAFELTEDGRFLWAGPSTITTDEIAMLDDEPPGAMGEAIDFLKTAFGDNESISAKEIEKQARELSISGRTLKRAKAQLGIKSRKTGDSWEWVMPTAKTQEPRSTTVPLAPISLFPEGGRSGRKKDEAPDPEDEGEL